MNSCKTCNNYFEDIKLNEKICKTCNLHLKKLYIVMISNTSCNTWDMTTGFYSKLEEAENIVKSLFYSMNIVSLDTKPTVEIFYTLDIYGENVKLISVCNKDQIINIKGGLFENE